MAATIDFWFEFASTYSYPAAMRIGPLAAAAGVHVRWRPFLLGSIFKAQGWPLDSPFNWQPAKGRYMWRDLQRICAELGLPLHRPDPFPQPSLLPARVAMVAFADAEAPEPWGEPFVRAVYLAEFGHRKQINDPGVVRDLLSEVGADADAVLAEAGSDATKARFRAETEEAERLGIFGAPTFVTSDGELFWGNDRLDAALQWARSVAAGATPPTTGAAQGATGGTA